MPGTDNEKNRKIKDLSKNTVIFTIGNFGSRILSFLLVPLYTYVLSTSEYGTIDIVNTTVQLLIPILTLNVQDSVLRFALDSDYRKEDVISISFRINCISACFLGSVLIIGFLVRALPFALNLMLFILLGKKVKLNLVELVCLLIQLVLLQEVKMIITILVKVILNKIFIRLEFGAIIFIMLQLCLHLNKNNIKI